MPKLKKVPQSATEIRYLLDQQIRKDLFDWMQTGQMIGKTVTIKIDHFNAGNLGAFECEVKKWIPP
jgi:hypothetical protein